MLTYQIRPRVFRNNEGQTLAFPAECKARLHFLPKQPFGAESGGGRTAVRAKPARVWFSMSSGAHWIESVEPLRPLEITIDDSGLKAQMRANLLEVSGRFETLNQLEEHLVGLYFALPLL